MSMIAASPITTVTRSTYTAAGQPIAFAPARFHIHTDHNNPLRRPLP